MLGKLFNLPSDVHGLDVTIRIDIYPEAFITLYCCRLYSGLFLLCRHYCYIFCCICGQEYLPSCHQTISNCCKVWKISVIVVKILMFLTCSWPSNLHRYLRTGFALDVLSIFPIQALVFSRKYGEGRIYSLLNMLRLWRLRRVSKFFIR